MLLTFSSEKKTCSCYMYRSLSFFSMLGLKDLNVPLFFFFFFVKHKNFTFKYKWVHSWGTFCFFVLGRWTEKKFFFPQLFFFFFFKLIHGVTALLHQTPSCSFAQYTVFKNGGGGEAVMEDTQAKVYIRGVRHSWNIETTEEGGLLEQLVLIIFISCFSCLRCSEFLHLTICENFKRTITSWEWCRFYWKYIY